MGRVDAHLGDPAQAERRHCVGEFRREGDVGGEIVVDEEVELRSRPRALGIGEDVGDGPVAGGAVEEGLDRAEVAGKAAAARGLDEPHRQVALAREQAPVLTDERKIRLRRGTPRVRKCDAIW